MSTATATLASSDDAFFHQRKFYLVFPVIIVPFLVALFWICSGGKGIASKDGGLAARFKGFNMKVPSAENSDLKKQALEPPGVGVAAGQTLSKFTNAEKIAASGGIRTIPSDQALEPAVTQAAYAAPNTATTQTNAAPTKYTTQPQKIHKGRRSARQQGFQYHAPQPYYVNSNQTDQQLENQLDSYQAARQGANTDQATQLAEPVAATSPKNSGHTPNFIQLADNPTASRLDQSAPSPVVESPFNTAPVGNNRQQEIASTLQSTGNNKRSVITLIPAVVHDDQSVRTGQTVKIRLTRAVVIDGIRVPANTILHATCLPDGDRLRLVVQNLQLGNQLIPLDLEAIDMDGGTGLNAPGLSDQIGGQLKSSAVQGVNLPTRSMLVNTVLNAARFGASSQVRQSQIYLKGGYQLHLKAI